MIEKLNFGEQLYDFIRKSNIAQVVRTKIFKLDNKTDLEAYQQLIAGYRKWIFWSKPHTFENVKVNEVFFDFERMVSEYSMHYGIKSGQEIMADGPLKPVNKSTVSTIEQMIKDSLDKMDQHIEKTADSNYSGFMKTVDSEWKKAFVINCIPNVLHGNYVNVPVEWVSSTVLASGSVMEFKDNEEYFFKFLNRLPFKINRIKIDGREFYNIVNVSIVPLFISTDTDYYLVHENS